MRLGYYRPLRAAAAEEATVDVALLADHHNSVVRRGYVRANDLVGKLETLLVPVLDDAADQAAAAFTRLAEKSAFTAAVNMTAGAVVATSEKGKEIGEVAAEHAPEGGYGDTAWNADEKTVWWVAADWSTNDEVDEAVAAFLAIDGVDTVEHDAEASLPEGDEWEVVYSSSALSAAATPGVTSTSTMVCLMPTPEQQAALAQAGGEDAAAIHCTLVFLGDVEGPLDPLRDALHPLAGVHGPLSGVVGGLGRFADNGDGAPLIALPDVPGLGELRVDVTEALVNAGIEYARTHGFTPHLTLGYGMPGEPPEDLHGLPLDFNDLWIVRGNEESIQIPLTGGKPVTAAGGKDDSSVGGVPMPQVKSPVDLPNWEIPPEEHLLDLDSLVAALREVTDPIRKQVVLTVGKATVEHEKNLAAAAKKKPQDKHGIADPAALIGISFDVNSPWAAAALDSAGQQITEIAKTTRRKVRDVIQNSYANGDSIPHTADAIRAVMKEANKGRATLIARTELAGGVNGGSLAATMQVDAALGGGAFQKVWLTAPGARFPRHEDYDGLDQQTQPLDQPFQVGDDQLMYPGDPSGSAENVCNCRCAVSYVAAGGEEVAQGDADNILDE